ncbi:O-antigen ligase family protein [Rhizomonospora bruguierae]|uniref:O-antigen ligase family protein n=1 Tax=Rhizomonospora bruguierae TaxID=1581705 RepID=UPI001BD0194F|nr:O-antigen ligase family protein [Micromonospora sp. NBRC 107566]
MTARAVHLADLEPSLIRERTYVTRRRYTRIDAAVLLSAMICLLDLIPASLILPGMTDIGRPALLVGMLLWFWWVLARLNPRLVMVGPQPIRWAVLIYGLSVLISYAVGFLRGLNEIEANGADRAMMSVAVFTGVILTAADGIPNWERLRGVLRVMVLCALFMALVGLIQFTTKVDLTEYLMVPGLQAKGWVPDFAARGAGDFFRVASTATHYIEFSTVMAMTLPLAIHFAIFSPTPKRRRFFIFASLVIAAAVPVALSRTGILALLVAVAVMVPVWGWRLRYNVLGFAAVLGALLMVGRPGLLGTLRDMFTNAQEDSSIQARTERYGLVGYYFAQRPWLGRGTGTWIAPQYQILDNQWLALALSNGMVGVAALAVLHITAVVLAIIALRRSDREGRHLCAALIAAQLIAVVGAATFDSLSFTTFSTTLALMTGFCGTVWRFTHPARTVRTSTPRWFAD